MTDWGKALGLAVLGLSVLGLAALAMSGGEEAESDGIPVTESPPEEITDTDEDDGE